MATVIRPEISTNNKYYIDKHRYYELKHFCLQYPIWKNLYSDLDDSSVSLSMISGAPSNNIPGDPTAKRAVMKAYYMQKIELLESTAMQADLYLHKYILRAVTEGLSYTNLKTRYDIPCGKDMYYDRYRRFFWLLSKSRD